MEGALRPGGRIATQAESLWNNQQLIAGLFRKTHHIFATVEYATTQIPTYPCGQIGFLMCSKDDGKTPNTCRRPVRAIDPAMQAELKFYSPELHEAAFVMPMFMRRVIDSTLKELGVNTSSSSSASSKDKDKQKDEGGHSARRSSSAGKKGTASPVSRQAKKRKADDED